MSCMIIRCSLVVMSKGNAPLGQRQVLAGLRHLIDWVSDASESVAAVVVAVAAAAATEAGLVEIADQTPAVEVL